jgi:exopolysaccharide biosynthesis polyprenyl glycosylphosphotransferase
MQVLGFVRVPNGKHHPDEVPEDEIIGNVEDVDRLVTQMGIQDVIVAVDPDKRADLVRVFQQVNHPDVGIKLLPDFHQLVIGLNKTNQIFGLPLIEISPDVMPLWEKITKRTLDIVFSLFGLIVTAPLLLILMVWIRKDSKGGALFKQVRVGRYGEPFTIYKLRTMVVDAEQETGPTWATENDPRVTGVGRILRKLRLDEIPQLYNVLKGEMSLVGPRPERPFFVEQFNKEIPMYFRRLRVRPGITGWAQVKWKYDTTLDDVFEKTKYDLFYVENMSLILDFKILFNTLFSVIRAKGQ